MIRITFLIFVCNLNIISVIIRNVIYGNGAFMLTVICLMKPLL